MMTYQPMQAAGALMKLGTHVGQMNLAAVEVVARRLIMMSRGEMNQSEAVGMVLEKATAFMAAGEMAALAAARGDDATKIAAAALRPIRIKARANARRLRR